MITIHSVAKLAPEKHVKILPDDGQGRRQLAIASGKVEALYAVQVVPSDWGQAFRIERLSTKEAYHVMIDLEGGRHSCECKGFLRWGHCKHAEVLAELTRRDWQEHAAKAA